MTRKREQLIDAAEALFYEQGFFATGIDAVITRAGTTRRTLYQHFDSKDALVVAALRQRERSYFEQLDHERPLGGHHSPAEIAAQIVRVHMHWLSDRGRRGCLFMRALEEYRAHSSLVMTVAEGHKRSLHRYLVRVLADAGEGNAERKALALGLLLEGATQYAQVFDKDLVRRSVVEQSAAVYPEIPKLLAAMEKPS